MLRGILKRESLVFNSFQKLIDPIILISIYNILFKKTNFFSAGQISFYVIINFIQNSNRIYESHRIKNLFNIIPKIFYICSSLTIFNLFLIDLNNTFDNSTFIGFFILCFGYLFFHHFLIRLFLRRIR